MPKEYEKGISCIKRYIDGTPTIIDGSIQGGCLFENSIIEGYGTIIIDKEFIDEILLITDESELPSELPSELTELMLYINNKVKEYFCSSITNNDSREDTYDKNCVLDNEGMIIGTKLSSLKGKNIALCSEKSIATYLILENLYKRGKISRRPLMVLSTLRTKNTPREPHAFILIDKEQDNYPTKYLLYDAQNPTLLENESGKRLYTPGLYTLSDEQHNNILNGCECTPLSLFEVICQDLHSVEDERIYGTKLLNKSYT